MKYIKINKNKIYILFTLLLIVVLGNVFANELIFNTKNINKTLNYRVKRDLSKIKDKKLIALTFDDGPAGKKTEKLLDGLEKHDAKVTFFLIGNKIDGQEELVKKIYNSGHTIGSHTFNHKNLFTVKKDEEILEEIELTNEKIKNIINEDVKFLRPPYGNYNHKILDLVDMSFILWNIDTQDWKVKNAKRISNYIVNNVSDGDIVLLHDIYKSSINGVLKAIEILEEDGYAFVSLEEMEEIRGEDFLSHKAYFKLK